MSQPAVAQHKHNPCIKAWSRHRAHHPDARSACYFPSYLIGSSLKGRMRHFYSNLELHRSSVHDASCLVLGERGGVRHATSISSTGFLYKNPKTSQQRADYKVHTSRSLAYTSPTILFPHCIELHTSSKSCIIVLALRLYFQRRALSRHS
jgi:hypothetical protein